MLVLPDAIDFHTIEFRDVPLSSDAYNSISKLCYFNVISGQNKNFFRPEDEITVNDLSVIIERIIKYEYPINASRPLERSRPKRSGPVDPDKNAPYIEPR